MSLPVLDLSQLDAGDAAADNFREDLRKATHDVGFFYLTGTGIPQALEERMLAISRQFFSLPEKDKLAIENSSSPHFRGYTRLGGERTLGAVDWREQIDISPEGIAFTPEQLRGQPAYARLVGPNQWPPALPELRDIVGEWKSHLAGVATKLLQAWAVALGEEPGFFDEAFADAFTLLKIVRYPQTNNSTQGVGAHKDAGALTLLWIEPNKPGLQVLGEDGVWLNAPPVSGALVVNIGEMLEYATQGHLKATTHRVLAPTDGDRISIPYFFNPGLGATFPLVRLPPGLDAAPGVSQDPSNPIHAKYGDNCLKSRLRAHPNVALRHHADLINLIEA